MELKRTGRKTLSAALGAVGLAAVACVACCLPLLAPLLAGLGLAGLGAAAACWYLAAAGVLVAGLALFLVARKRRAASCQPSEASSCGCASNCKTS